MKLLELHPEQVADKLYFDCPRCLDGFCRLCISYADREVAGSLASLTVRPSIGVYKESPDAFHWHGYITDGEVVTC